MPNDDKVRHVYFARQGNLIKIGFSAHLVNRIRDFGPCEFLGAMPGDANDESRIHAQFDHLRMPRGKRGGQREVFLADPALLEFIEQNCPIKTLPVMVRKPPTWSWWVRAKHVR